MLSIRNPSIRNRQFNPQCPDRQIVNAPEGLVAQACPSRPGLPELRPRPFGRILTGDGARRMPRKMVRILLSAVVVGGALIALLATTMRVDAQYYKRVDEVMPTAAEWYGKGLQLHGYVVDGTIQRRPNSFDHRFQIKNGDSVVLASYTGVLPDTFKDGSEVVLKGRLGPGGFQVEPNGVMAKCPSRYEAAPAIPQ
jgi:cytochrome c-type biogenesis protein CcmE